MAAFLDRDQYVGLLEKLISLTHTDKVLWRRDSQNAGFCASLPVGYIYEIAQVGVTRPVTYTFIIRNKDNHKVIYSWMMAASQRHTDISHYVADLYVEATNNYDRQDQQHLQKAISVLDAL